MEAEGAQYHYDHPEDEQMNRAVLSLVGKGKGGKIRGKRNIGKGGKASKSGGKGTGGVKEGKGKMSSR